MLWIGTSDGLNVFNRETETFTSYVYDAGDKNSISDNYITAIYEDSRGMLWIGTSDGLNVFNRETETFTSYVYDAGDGNSISDNYITAIYEDSRGMLWIGTSDGLNVFNREPETFTAYVYDAGDENSISNNNVLCICEDVYGYIWIGTNYGLNRFDVENGLFYTYFSSMNTISGIASNNIQSSCVDSEGILWFGTSNGVSKLNFNKNVFNYYINELSVDVYGMCSNDNETLWVKTSSSVVSLDLQTHQIENVYTNAFKSKYISELRYNTFCVSGNRYLFSGTMGFGLEVYDIANQKLITYTAEKGNDKSLSGDTITSLYTDDNDVVWIGTTGGLCSYNTGTGDFTQYKDYSDDISGNVWVIYGTADRKMLFATDVAIYMLDNSGKIVCMVDNVSSAMYGTSGSGISILTMYEDNAGRLWIGTNNGLCCYDIKNRKFISYEVTEAVSMIGC
jgi:ligand-binding sensor domain-containing protein